MTTTTETETRTRRRRWQRVLATGAVLACLPYATLKVIWLLGSDVGLNDPELVRSAAMEVANLLTFSMAVCGAVLAVAMTRDSGMRMPAWVVLPPVFVGTGLLGGILVLMPVQALLPLPESIEEMASPIRDWVFLVAYGGFVVLGMCLLPLAIWYCRRRWLSRWSTPLASWPSTPRPLALLASGYGLVLVALCVTEMVVQRSHDGAVGGHQVVAVLMSLVCLTGLVQLVRRESGRGSSAILMAFAGTAVIASWGLYFAVVMLVPNPLVGDQQIPVSLVAVEALKAALGAGTLLLLRGLVSRAPALD